MSETESKTGKLKVFPRITDETDKDYVFRFIETSGVKIPDYYENPEDDLQELFSDLFYGEAIFYKGVIYQVYDVADREESDIFEARKIEGGDIGFVVQFYNGGCSFNEAVGYALENLNR